jgi:hypothetical protein
LSSKDSCRQVSSTLDRGFVSHSEVSGDNFGDNFRERAARYRLLSSQPNEVPEMYPYGILLEGGYLGRSTIIKSGHERPSPSDLGEYAREAVRAVEDVPAALIAAMGNVFEAFSLMRRVRDDYAAREGKITFPKIQSNDLSKVIIERDY